eukprot:CAMPEP_0197701492 /NCGR_PEP_ID=MMETSP1338-20131121/123307_1 /TAXON_ID=43686 ORGANISM="Pelagodinium beii, Strain RCC1491" /NCGR_SAMPLE_ID=MMETSP1338 /ASSEMBLY_ACC=CAM_ASM_000754 /LENGTH=60 /DNA_ID=CAMNT_0043285193 /DNA_START=165 /DNA_END=350 /DNA_ORIENTATION=-
MWSEDVLRAVFVKPPTRIQAQRMAPKGTLRKQLCTPLEESAVGRVVGDPNTVLILADVPR